MEVDGGSRNEQKYDYNKFRQETFESMDIKFLRFTEYEVVNSAANVTETIERFINKKY